MTDDLLTAAVGVTALGVAGFVIGKLAYSALKDFTKLVDDLSSSVDGARDSYNSVRDELKVPLRDRVVGWIGSSIPNVTGWGPVI